MDAVTEVNLWSFLAYLALMLAGCWYHWHKMVKEGRVAGTFKDYLLADYPGRSVATILLVIGAAWTSASAGLADNINPELLWGMLMAAKLSVAPINACFSALISGYGIDSLANKGGKP